MIAAQIVASLHSDPTYEAWKLLSLFPRTWIISFIPILPMRHGNNFPQNLHSSELRYSDPTYEAWKQKVFEDNKRQRSDSDPTYEAWKPSIIDSRIIVSFLIPILPMRHGNYEDRSISILLVFHSDPTYEAWKPMMSGVLITNSETFRSYLWGMETAEDCQRRDDLQIIPILPMRHGNSITTSLPALSKTIPILPMRHGNTTLASCTTTSSAYSDPTYEAWKRVLKAIYEIK